MRCCACVLDAGRFHRLRGLSRRSSGTAVRGQLLAHRDRRRTRLRRRGGACRNSGRWGIAARGCCLPRATPGGGARVPLRGLREPGSFARLWLHYFVLLSVPLAIARPRFSRALAAADSPLGVPTSGNGDGVQPFVPAIVVARVHRRTRLLWPRYQRRVRKRRRDDRKPRPIAARPGPRRTLTCRASHGWPRSSSSARFPRSSLALLASACTARRSRPTSTSSTARHRRSSRQESVPPNGESMTPSGGPYPIRRCRRFS